MRIDKTILIDANPDKIWPWLIEFDKLSQWNKGMIEEKKISEGTPGVGFISTIAIKEGGKINWYENEIIEWIPNERLVILLRGKNLGKNPMHVSYDLSLVEEGTQLHYVSTWSPHGFMLKLLHPIIKMVANNNANKCIAKLALHMSTIRARDSES